MKSDGRLNLRGPAWTVSVAVLAGLLGATGVTRADSAVVLGAGQIGTWSTTAYVANPNSSQAEMIEAPSPISSPPEGAPLCSPEDLCPFYGVLLPPLGTKGLNLNFTNFGFGTAYLTQKTPTPPGQAFPVIRATIAQDDSRSANIPVVLVSKLIAANLSTLTFPGVILAPIAPGAGSQHDNLVLGNIQRTDGVAAEALPLKLELFDDTGALVGSTFLTLSYGQTLVVGDLVSYFGVQVPTFVGQLRVTRLSGGALLWGIMYTEDGFSGGVTATAGANLSP